MKLLFSIFISLFSLVSFAQSGELVTVKFDGTSEAATAAEAVREVTAKATDSTARNQVIDLIGEAKYRKNKALIDSKIINQSSKFIPFTNPGQAIQIANGFKVSVELKVSPESLRSLVQSAGLLADTESPGTFISLVGFTNKSNDLTYKWWSPEPTEGKKDLVALNQLWQQAINTELEKKNFKIAKIQKQSADEREVITAAQAQMFLRGEVRIRSNEDGSGSLAFKVGVYQSSDSRLLADITRTAKIPRLGEASIKAAASQMFKETSNELAQTVYEAWQSGVVGSSLVQIVANGVLTPKQLEAFKTELTRSLKDLKNVKERKFSSQSVVLEADFKGSLASLSERLRQTQLPSFQTEVEGATDTQVALKVKARR